MEIPGEISSVQLAIGYDIQACLGHIHDGKIDCIDHILADNPSGCRQCGHKPDFD